MKRRKFIGIISLGVVGSAIGLLSLPGFEEIIADLLIKDTKRLSISEKVYKKYLKDASERDIWKRFSYSKREFFRAHYFISNELFQLPYYEKYKQYRSEIVGNFLLSTDFFQNKMNERLPVNYVAIYDPYFRPCSNPFSNLYY